MDLLEKRSAVLAEHAAMERHHPHWKAEAAAGRKITDRPVAFQCDDAVCVVGDCVPKVLAGLGDFLARGDEYAARLPVEPALRQAVAVAKRLTEAGESPGQIVLTTQQWNCVSAALGHCGIDCVLADGATPPAPDA
jgi:hypothetical protein